MGQGTETCANRSTEVSVIRFVSRNRTIEEIAPKKEVYMCKQRDCGKKFTNQDEYQTHEILEALKIRFICREPDCGEELSDPGSMWRHYQEWHNNETNVFVCPYTSCNAVQTTSENLEEHIEQCHRQLPTLPMEPEVICFEGPENAMANEAERTSDDFFDSDKFHSSSKKEAFALNKYPNKDEPARASESSESLCFDFPKNEDLLITKDNFLTKYEPGSKSSESLLENSQEENGVVFIKGNVTITMNAKNDHLSKQNSDDGSERGCRGIVEELEKPEDHASNHVDNCSEDEEYTPKKQRMSRYKQESLKCSVIGCNEMYKYISHYHHPDNHKLPPSVACKKLQKPKHRKATTVSFFLCKVPGCGAEINDVTGLWKHYQDNHADSKLPVDQVVKNNETFRCNVPGCDSEFDSNCMLYKHLNEHHTNNSITNTSTKAKTGIYNSGSIHFVSHMFHDDADKQNVKCKTEVNAKHNDNITEYSKSSNDKSLSLVVKEELRD